MRILPDSRIYKKYLILRDFSYRKASTELEEARHWDSVEASARKTGNSTPLALGRFITVARWPVNAKPRGNIHHIAASIYDLSILVRM
jgi:hypothetical protein